MTLNFLQSNSAILLGSPTQLHTNATDMKPVKKNTGTRINPKGPLLGSLVVWL